MVYYSFYESFLRKLFIIWADIPVTFRGVTVSSCSGNLQKNVAEVAMR